MLIVLATIINTQTNVKKNIGKKKCYDLHYLAFFSELRLNPGAFYLRAIPPALFFILYFETGSKLWRASLNS